MKRKPLTYEQIFKMYKKLYKDDSEAELFYSKSIRLMHQIFQDVSKSEAQEYMKTKKYLTGAKAISKLYEIKILHHFVAHQTLLKNGITIASYNHIRSIYELIIAIYLNIIEPDLGELNFNYETKESNKELSKRQLEDIKKQYAQNEYLKPSFIEKKLYSGKTLHSMRDFYHNICGFIHPSIISMAACFEFKPNTFIDSSKVGIALTNINFIILFELYGDKIKKRYKKKLLELVNEYPTFIPEGMPALIPSKGKEKLKIKDYNCLINILEKI